ncbi:MAG: 3-isopropylmalate dehydrogenase [Clostridiaceae bacterium]|jgi:3-isopropylmalate dehydrogenase|nr:3-isopropylmalate dehydrogenase [Clostridiaceae bacterium]
MDYNIALVKGDGIGPEIIDATIPVLERVGEIYGHKFYFREILAGGCAVDKIGVPITDEALDVCRKSDAVMLGAVGGLKWDNLPGDKRPEIALFRLRGELGLFTNIRPATLHEALRDACPLKPELVDKGIDLVIIRELTGGIYFGERGRYIKDNIETAYDTMPYSVYEIERIGRVAFEIARKRRKKLCSVDKANVLETSRLWRQVMHRIKEEYPDVEYSDMLVDNAAMQLVRAPYQFDVIVTENMFGDILSDEASIITGSIGMLPSASIGSSTFGMYEPIHGSAPDIAGRDIANPLATILSAAMMLRYSFSLETEARTIERAVTEVLNKGFRTQDIKDNDSIIVGTKEMSRLVCDGIK